MILSIQHEGLLPRLLVPPLVRPDFHAPPEERLTISCHAKVVNIKAQFYKVLCIWQVLRIRHCIPN